MFTPTSVEQLSPANGILGENEYGQVLAVPIGSELVYSLEPSNEATYEKSVQSCMCSQLLAFDSNHAEAFCSPFLRSFASHQVISGFFHSFAERAFVAMLGVPSVLYAVGR